MSKKLGEQSLIFETQPKIISTANIVGPLEGKGPLKEFYDFILKDNLNNLDSWEKAESYMLEWAVKKAAEKGYKTIDDIDIMFAGDLLNQLMSSHFAARQLARPFLGLYGACSTLVEGMIIGSVFIEGSFASNVISAVSSHHDAAERQYRFPTELGTQRPPISQWTVTGSGAMVISNTGESPKITTATVGKVIDMGIKDANAMGPAMAPAAADTIRQHLQDTDRLPNYYDMIYTGDLGKIGKALVIDLLKEKGNIDITSNYEDCGCLIYSEDQDTHSGASGCASSAITFTGYIYQKLLKNTLKKVLLVGTGSLHSPTSYLQRESLPGIAHAVSIEI
ncbi:stage V sporulation protein AD [Selenomonadales bacterium OttesenSCG-928-I06]|nr:stage V sporulation protein AD [Selenomonadales bacterium OttesenSCG-928-I06]